MDDDNLTAIVIRYDGFCFSITGFFRFHSGYTALYTANIPVSRYVDSADGWKPDEENWPFGGKRGSPHSNLIPDRIKRNDRSCIPIP